MNLKENVVIYSSGDLDEATSLAEPNAVHYFRGWVSFWIIIRRRLTGKKLILSEFFKGNVAGWKCPSQTALFSGNYTKVSQSHKVPFQAGGYWLSSREEYAIISMMLLQIKKWFTMLLSAFLELRGGLIPSPETGMWFKLRSSIKNCFCNLKTGIGLHIYPCGEKVTLC